MVTSIAARHLGILHGAKSRKDDFPEIELRQLLIRVCSLGNDNVALFAGRVGASIRVGETMGNFVGDTVFVTVLSTLLLHRGSWR